VILPHGEILSWRIAFANQNFLLLQISHCGRRDAPSLFEVDVYADAVCELRFVFRKD
jgi:hypothetical protein